MKFKHESRLTLIQLITGKNQSPALQNQFVHLKMANQAETCRVCVYLQEEKKAARR
jgi:hypothetical protein